MSTAPFRPALAFVAALLVLGTAAVPAAAQEESYWPREIVLPEGKVVVYTPQLESMSGDKLSARAAVSVTPQGKTTPVFGAVWIDARMSTDVQTKAVTLTEVKVTSAKFPDQKEETVAKVKAAIEGDHWNPELNYDDLKASMDLTNQERALAGDFRNEAPAIVFKTKPTVFVFIDGPPEARPFEGTSYKRIVNTMYPMFEVNGRYMLRASKYWYSAPDPLKGPWAVEGNPPADLVDAVRQLEEKGEANQEEDSGIREGVIPDIVTGTEPTEVVVTDGAPDIQSIEGTSLLYVANTEHNLFRDINTQSMYLLCSGRWFTAKSESGPWTYVDPESLPADFKKIPKTAGPADVLASVPGTEESKEAILEAQIPQTAAVQRSTGKLNVVYDGEAKFIGAGVEGLLYATNTATPVFLLGGRYYACDNAVWFESDGANGPWIVADKIPDQIYKLPPTNPYYNVTGVRIYESTPEVVYVGYTPAYTGCYVMGPTVVYGTGYYYPGYYGPVVYAPRPISWGFNFSYNPYTGWGMGVTVGGPHFTMSFGGYGGWYGPPMYRPPYRPPYAYRPGYYRPPYYRPPSYYRPSGGRPPTYRPPGNSVATRPSNVYNKRPDNAARPVAPSTLPSKRPGTPSTRPSTPGASTRPATPSTRPAPTTRPSTKPNNVYTDRNGDVYRNNNGGWQQQQPSGGWSKPAPSNSRPDLNRDMQTRQRPQNSSRPSSSSRPASRPSGGGARGGGGRR